LLNRREFNKLCVALSSFVTASGASALDAATGAAQNGAGRMVRFRDGTIVPALGQGSADLGKEDILKLLKKKRCARAFRSG
jgi:hypothetical protein